MMCGRKPKTLHLLRECHDRSGVSAGAVRNLSNSDCGEQSSHSCYADHSFINERSGRLRGSYLVFVELINVDNPFDTLRFVEVDAAFTPTGPNVKLPLVPATPELAAREGRNLRYLDLVEYFE